MGEDLAERAGSWDAVSWRRSASCGLPMGDQVCVIWSTSADSAYVGGDISTCASVWACAVCTARIRTVRTREVEQIARWWCEGGRGALLMLTLTVQHTEDDDLRDLLKPCLLAGYRRLQQSRFWRHHVKGAVVHQIRSLEVTHSFYGDGGHANGWHPHLHVLLLVEGWCADRICKRLARHLPGHWASTIRSLGGDAARHEPRADGIGCRVQRIGADAARYVTKIANEVTRSDLKGQERQPWAMLEHGDVARWDEYVQATKDCRAVQFSRGLREAAGLLSADDDESAMLLDLEDGLIVAQLETRRYVALLRSGRLAALLESYEVRCRAVRRDSS